MDRRKGFFYVPVPKPGEVLGLGRAWFIIRKNPTGMVELLLGLNAIFRGIMLFSWPNEFHHPVVNLWLGPGMTTLWGISLFFLGLFQWYGLLWIHSWLRVTCAAILAGMSVYIMWGYVIFAPHDRGILQYVMTCLAYSWVAVRNYPPWRPRPFCKDGFIHPHD